MFQIQTNSEILQQALVALSHFTALDILSIFPNSPKILLSQILSGVSTIKEWQIVFNQLILHEVDHMRRGLIKGTHGIKSPAHTGAIGAKEIQFKKFKEQLKS